MTDTPTPEAVAAQEEIGILRGTVEAQAAEIARLTRIIQMQPTRPQDAQSSGQGKWHSARVDADGKVHFPPCRDAQAVRDAALREAAEVAARFGPERPLVARNPKDRIMGRWEGEQAASASIAAAILALICKEGA